MTTSVTRCTLDGGARPDGAGLLGAYRAGQSSVFVSPSRTLLAANPLTGSIPRSTDPAEDARRAAGLRPAGTTAAGTWKG